MPWRRLAPLLTLLAAIAAIEAASTIAGAQRRGADAAKTDGAAKGEWPYYSGDNGARKYSPLDQITKENVAALQIAWRRPQIDPALAALLPPNFRLSNNFRSTPLMVHGVMYASNGIGLAEAFDPATGKTIWVQKPGAEEVRGGASNRGVGYWSQGADERLFSFRGHSLFALNPKTGEPVPDFGNKGAVDLDEGLDTTLGQWHWTSAPLVVKDVVVMGSAMAEQDSATKKEGQPGEVRGYDVHSGKLRWSFHIVPREGEDGRETWEDEAWRYTGAGNVWALMSADDDLGYVYLPTTSVTNDMYGGHRKGDALFSDCIVCLDARTGRRVWYYQTVHHDLFDYDNPAAPILADITVDGRKIKAVVQITKQSFAYVLDRTNGRPVWPIEERPVPQSDVPGEQSSPTQPFPTKPPAFDRQSLIDDDLIDFTPELRATALDVLKRYKVGDSPFTPPILGNVNGVLGAIGAGTATNWPGSAADPEQHVVYAQASNAPSARSLVAPPPGFSDIKYVSGVGGQEFREVFGPGDCCAADAPPRPTAPASAQAQAAQAAAAPVGLQVQGLPIYKPPYGIISAINLDRGEIAWQTPHGDTPDQIRTHPALAGLNLPKTGQPGTSGVGLMVTKTLVVMGDPQVTAPPGRQRGAMLRAYDKATGREVGAVWMPAAQSGSPMTYSVDGKQYIVVAIGGGVYSGEYVAFSLPGAGRPSSQ